MPNRTNALFDRNQVFILAAAIGAHAHAKGEGFRQRDVKFLVELFANWVEHTLEFKSLMLQNTQVARYLAELVQEGFARRISKNNMPLYRLTRVGLVELAARMISPDYYERPERFLFVYHFIKHYKERIAVLVKSEGTQFPPALDLELKSILNEKTLLDRQIRNTEQEIERLNIRISSALETSKLSAAMYRKGCSDEQVVEMVDLKHPYELSSQKTLSELFKDIPESVRRWELEAGTLKRAEEIWVPSRNLMMGYLKILRGLG